MFQQLQGTLRFSRKNGFIFSASRFVMVVGLALALPMSAYAYTVIMRGGHRVEIPDKFSVTPITLTYEKAPGVSITIQISMIDIEATERANQEPSGSLLGRATAENDHHTVWTGGTPGQRARRTVTNSDLEEIRRTRLASEVAYERRRQASGWTSRKESERLRQEEAMRARQILRDSEAQKAEAESYWRERSAALRNEIYALDAEINYVRSSLGQLPESVGAVAYGIPPPFIYSTPGSVIYDSTRPRVVRPCPFPPCYPDVVVTPPFDYSSYDRAQLTSRLRELEASRAGLQARWRVMEEEARRAGAQPGWLRP